METCGDFLIERLFQWGIERIYGYPGDGINGIVGALERAEDKIEFVQVRHEEMAAFMACGHAKFTGHVGVCLATSGPGAIHLLNGLYDAKMDHQPEFLPKTGQARCVQIDIDPRMLSIRYPAEVCLNGDSAETLRKLLPLLKPQRDRVWRKKIENGIAGWWKILEARAMNEANPLNPQLVFWELSPRLPDNCIIASDSGSAATWFARDLKIRPGMMASLSGTFATMGPGMPYAIAAKFAFPDRVAIACVGDGAMQMNGINGLVTISKYWKQWADPRLIVLVLNNGDLNMVTWEQRVMSGDPKFTRSQNLPDFSHARYAEMLGLKGIRLDNPDRVTMAWEEAFDADCPVVIDAVVDPEVPLLPPHISLRQARNFARALLHHDEHAGRMLRQSHRDIIENYLPHKSQVAAVGHQAAAVKI